MAAAAETEFTRDEVAVPHGSNSLALCYLNFLEQMHDLELESRPAKSEFTEDPEDPVHHANRIRDTNLEKWLDEQRHPNEDKEVEKELDEAQLLQLEELKKPLDTVPMMSLVTPDACHASPFRSEVEENREKIMSKYPNIPIKKIEHLDIYLHAYGNFLKRWVPDLEFNYTDPGKIEGHIGELRNAIKLAFSDQYNIIRKAYMEVREHIYKDLKLALPLPGQELPPTMRRAHRLLEEDRLKPNLFNRMVDEVFDSLEQKEILDICGEKGHGYFLLWRDPENVKNLYALPTLGSFGYFLPEPGFSLVKEFGWPYFRDTQIIGFQVGHLRKILIENAEGEWEDWELKEPIYLEISESEYDDNSISRIQIDGHFFQGTIYAAIQ